jgi:hypothetical protein
VTRVLLIVADPGDTGGRAAARVAALPPRSPGGVDHEVVVLSGDELAAARWSHHVDSAGVARTSVRLPGPDAPVLTDDNLAAVWFRSQQWRVPPVLRAAAAADAAYARAELTALLVSWLASIGPRTVNACEGLSPTGPSWSPARWRQLAAEHGLPVAGSEGVAIRSVLVAGSHMVGARDTEEHRRCRQLAAAGSCRIVEVGLDGADRVTGVATVPSLRGSAQIAAAAAMLQEVAS